VGDREPEATGPLKYAPKWARMAKPAAPAFAGGRGGANARPREHEPAAERWHSQERSPPERTPARSRPQESAPPWKLIGRPGAFEGDVAIKELRERMALAPDRPPEPPIRDKGGAVFGMVGRRAWLVALAAAAAYGFVPGNQLEGQGFALAATQKALLAVSQLCPSVSLVVPGQPPAPRRFWCPRPHTIMLVSSPQSSAEVRAAEVTGGERANTTGSWRITLSPR